MSDAQQERLGWVAARGQDLISAIAEPMTGQGWELSATPQALYGQSRLVAVGDLVPLNFGSRGSCHSRVKGLNNRCGSSWLAPAAPDGPVATLSRHPSQRLRTVMPEVMNQQRAVENPRPIQGNPSSEGYSTNTGKPPTSPILSLTLLFLLYPSTMKPKFQIGDMIQSGSAPQIVYLIRGFESSTYTLSSPDKNDNWIVKAQSEVDQYFRKNAREFNRQEKELNSVPPEPGFDEDGSPTYEEDH